MTALSEGRSAAADLLRDRGLLRVALRGNSMLPSLSEPMVLQVGPPSGVRIGDVLVYRAGDLQVAHRVVGIDADGYRTAGDRQPACVERVSAADVVGRVVAVWSDASPSARRVDRSHRVRSWYFSRFRALRARTSRLRERLIDLATRAQPRRRGRYTLQLCEALAAATHRDAGALAASLSLAVVGPGSPGARHRCVAVLGEASRRLGILDRIPGDAAREMQRHRVAAVLATARMRDAVCTLVETLNDVGVPFALLKGAARVYEEDPDASYHTSDDIDVLIARADRDLVVSAMRLRGYAPVEPERLFRRHHHAVPLFPKDGRYPVELHDQLAPVGSVSLATDWAALGIMLSPVAGRAGRVLKLDPVGTALHLAIHAIGLRRLRDVALLANVLRAMDPAQRAALRTLVGTERKEPVRLQAPIVLAARIAGVAWDASPVVERYLDWTLLREDLPRPLRARCDAVDAYFAAPGAPWSAFRGLIPWWSRGSELAVAPVRVAGLCATNAAAIVYAALMPKDQNGKGAG